LITLFEKRQYITWIYHIRFVPHNKAVIITWTYWFKGADLFSATDSLITHNNINCTVFAN